MSKYELSRPYRTTLKTLSMVLMAGTIAGCSSDMSRFSYHNALNDGQLTTASVKQPLADGLAPVGNGTQTQSYPGDYRAPSTYQRQAIVQQYPDATRSPSPIHTASISNNPANAPRDLYQAAATPAKQTSVVRETLPASTKPSFADKVRKALSRKEKKSLNNVVEAPIVAKAPVRMIAPSTQDSIVTGSIKPVSQPKSLVPMTPDPIVTGSIPPKTQARKGGWSTIGGTKVSLSEGETVYNLSRRYGVPAAEILRANNIVDSRTIKSGQILTIPVYAYSSAAPVSAPDNDVLTKSANSHRGSKTMFPRGSSAPVPNVRDGMLKVVSKKPFATPTKKVVSNTGAYTVSSGDTLNRVAYKHGVSVSALKAANGLSSSNIRIGQRLTIPNKSFKAMAPDNTMTASVSAKVPVVDRTGREKIAATKKSISEKNDALTRTAKIETDVVAPKKTGIDKLRWPAKGQIVTSFGGKTEAGKRNDGIDILMPEGSPIKAAENGVVIYADSGLKGFGNTVLVRHDDNLVTVYAHARSLNVSRGDKVTRGQVVAHSGMSGSAKRPKLHFEVRDKAVPKNPISYLE
ncbi:peptidoglycan DD-metalloendopeptidase family protein [Lentilitoribacter sp. EG35]|uniref:peptidoglycan DD-metalloendopeptidase family protein n=1 Tax=Lentilitoribacter sp. EG35 TaxID=3234192 RepID=UPI00345F85AF